MLQKETVFLIGYFVFVIFLLVTLVVLFFISFQRKKNKLLIEKFEREKQYEREIQESRLEIQEQTFKNIAWELHDNIGQLLSVTNLQLNMLLKTIPETFQKNLTEATTNIQSTVQQVRALSRNLNNDVIFKNGLELSIKNELERFQRLNFLKTSYQLVGESIRLKKETEIIIFRIFQEFTTNVLKHSRAEMLDVLLKYTDVFVEVQVIDNGIGFDMDKKSSNSGLETMSNRAKLLKADFKIESSIGNGTRLFIKYPYINEAYGSN